MSAEDKNKLDSIKVYRKTIETLSQLPTDTYGWYTIAEIDDTESSLFQVSTGGHSDVVFTVSTGWKDNLGGSLTILNSFYDQSSNDVNTSHTHVRKVRIRKSNQKLQVEIELKNLQLILSNT